MRRLATVAVMLVAVSRAVVGAERVPEAAVVGGIPQGMFVSRSLLTGRAVCLLFLSGGRVTRAIPEGGLENFEWTTHRANHGGDIGRWEMRGGMTGTVAISGSTITFRSDAGAATAYTFLAVAGTPIAAFSADANMFTRTQ